MDPKSKKGLYYRSKAQKETEKFKESVETIKTYLNFYPEDVDGKNMLAATHLAWRKD